MEKKNYLLNKKVKIFDKDLKKENLLKIYKLSLSVNIYKPKDIIKVYFLCLKEDYISFKQKITNIHGINYKESRQLFKSYVSKQLFEIGKFIFYKNKENNPIINEKGNRHQLLKLFKTQKKKDKVSQVYCPFCAKSLYYLTRHFFDIRTENSQGCQLFYNVLLSIDSFHKQVLLYYDIFKYIYPSLSALKYENFYNTIKSKLSGKQMPKKPIRNVKQAYSFTGFLHKLLRNFQFGNKVKGKIKINNNNYNIDLDEEIYEENNNLLNYKSNKKKNNYYFFN